MEVLVSVIYLQVEGRNFSWADFQHSVLANHFFTKLLWSLDAILSQGMQYYSCPLLSEKKQVIMMVEQVQGAVKPRGKTRPDLGVGRLFQSTWHLCCLGAHRDDPCQVVFPGEGNTLW